jgi:hypothetical protein
MYGIEFAYESHPKFIGIIFDKGLSFSQHIEQIRDKCVSDKCSLKHKLENLKKTLISIYYALVRSLSIINRSSEKLSLKLPYRNC